MYKTLFIILLIFLNPLSAFSQNTLVFQSDFGTADGAVATMKGVALCVSPTLRIYDLTHEIPPFNVWEAAYRLWQTAQFWPPGTVFVSVVDPGVGTNRQSVVLKTKSGHYFVSPDNGTLTLVAEHLAVAALREIDEASNRRQDSSQSYTFHGRDIYAFTGARLAAGVINFKQVGPELRSDVVRIPYQKAELRDGILHGNIPVLDVRYGNVWTNIGRELLHRLGVKIADSLNVKIQQYKKVVFYARVPLVHTFGDVPAGQPLLYFNSLQQLALALNRGSFAEKFKIAAGADWRVKITK